MTISFWVAWGGDTIHGNDGNDVVLGDNGRVSGVTYGASGLVSVDEVSSEVLALGGDDTIYGNAGSDLILGGCGSDTIYGGNSVAANSPVAGSDADIIVGDNGSLLTASWTASGFDAGHGGDDRHDQWHRRD